MRIAAFTLIIGVTWTSMTSAQPPASPVVLTLQEAERRSVDLNPQIRAGHAAALAASETDSPGEIGVLSDGVRQPHGRRRHGRDAHCGGWPEQPDDSRPLRGRRRRLAAADRLRPDQQPGARLDAGRRFAGKRCRRPSRRRAASSRSCLFQRPAGGSGVARRTADGRRQAVGGRSDQGAGRPAD